MPTSLAAIFVLAPLGGTLEDLQAQVLEILRRTGTPGAGIALVERDRVLWTGGIGVADVLSNRPATEDTLFRIGSITKTFTALAVLTLVEEGRLDLEAKLADLAPEIAFENPWESSDPVRIVHLLEHTTGWDDISARAEAHSVEPPVSLREGLEIDAATRTCRWPPGRSMAYCNSGPAVAAYVVEKLMGQRFEDLVRERVFVPLGMTTAEFFRTPAAAERLATGYELLQPVEYAHVCLRPSGAINASASEMASFVRMFLNDGSGGRAGDRAVVSPASIARMETPRSSRAARSGIAAGYGLNDFTTSREGFLLHGHNGGLAGHLAVMNYHRGLGRGYSIAINSGSFPALKEIEDHVLAFLMDGLAPDAKEPAVAVDRASLEAVTGWYEPISPRNQVLWFVERILALERVRMEGDDLVLEPFLGSGDPLVPVAGGRFRRADEPIATACFFPRADEGAQEATFGMGRDARRVPELVVDLRLFLAAGSIVCMASSLLFALVWLPRRWFFGLRGAKGMSVRALPAIASACFFAAALLIVFGSLSLDASRRFGTPTFWSIGFYLLMLAFAATSILASIQVARRWSSTPGLLVRVHSLLVAASCCVVTGYLAWHGLIGWRSWA